jgi:hypothetical protein
MRTRANANSRYAANRKASPIMAKRSSWTGSPPIFCGPAGYLEQMLNELADADIAICEILHSYSGWVVSSRNGSGLLVARASLVARCRGPA